MPTGNSRSRHAQSVGGFRRDADEGALATGVTEIVVLDDDKPFVQAVVERLREEGIAALGYSSAKDFGRAARGGQLRNVKLMFFDMDLSSRSRGSRKITAADVIPVARTYVPSANVIIFSEGISLENCILCVRLGALGLIPKSDNLEQLLLAAKVYPHIGNPERAIEATIDDLWARLQGADARDKGQLLEMLTANLLATVKGLSFVDNNLQILEGEIDLVFENNVDRPFWHKLDSFHVIVECKNRLAAPEKEEFNALAAKVAGKHSCRAGILVSWEGVSRGFRDLQRAKAEGYKIFAIGQPDLAILKSMPRSDREPHLTEILARQL